MQGGFEDVLRGENAAWEAHVVGVGEQRGGIAIFYKPWGI